MKKIFLILFLIPAFAMAQSDAANQTQIDSLLINSAKKNNAKFFWRMLSNANASKLNKDSLMFNPTLKDTTFNIGVWDMDTLTFKTVAHGLSNFKNVRSVSIIIRNDADNDYRDLYYLAAGSMTYIDNTNVHLNRILSGFFDSASYSNGANRGWITIRYLP